MSEREQLSPRSWLVLERKWLPDRLELAGRLERELVWEQREIVLFGKRILQPRLIAWAGEVGYRYSGQTLEPRAFTPVASELRSRVERRSESRFNHVLVNRYRDQNDSMGYHSDDEPELGPEPLLASLSLGAPRRFVILPKKKRSGIEPRTLWLEDGDLLIMGGAFQHELRHGVPRERGAAGERINLTFRRLDASPLSASAGSSA